MSETGLSLQFRSEAVPSDALLVAKVVGEEQISGVYTFDVELLSRDANLDLDAILYKPARVGIRHRIDVGGDKASLTRWMGGVCAEISVQGEEDGGWMRYRARVVPNLWLTTQSHRSRVFLEGTTPENVGHVLAGYGMHAGDQFEFRSAEPAHDYVVQYQETDFAFISRWLEFEGFHYYFQSDGTDEKLVFGDSNAYPAIEGEPRLRYLRRGVGAQGQSGDASGDEEVVRSFTCTQGRLPAELSLNDYNWRDPSLVLRCTTPIRPEGWGVHYEYNQHYRTLDEGEALAKIRVDELTCRERVYRGDSNCAGFRPGLTFDLQGHPRADFNQRYVLTRVRHVAEQGIALSRGGALTGTTYTNTFAAIPAERVFRPRRTTPWPTIRGMMHAKVDAEGDGEYAELDDLGRYKVQIPFDQELGDREPGRASRYMRMAQPYAGVDSGMHFPLLKGTEVLLSHIDGHPDRPLIASAVPNPETVSPVDAGTHTKNRIRTTSGHLFEMDDDSTWAGFVVADASATDVMETRSTVAARMGGPSGGGGDAEGKRQRPWTARRVSPSPAAPGAAPPNAESPGAGAGADEILSSADPAGGSTSVWNEFQASVNAVESTFNMGTYNLKNNFDAVTSLNTGTSSDMTSISGASFPSVPTNLKGSGGQPPSFPNWCRVSFPGQGAENLGATAIDPANSNAVRAGAKLLGVNKTRVEVRNGNQYYLEHGLAKIRYLDVSNDISIGTGGYTFSLDRGPSTSESIAENNVYSASVFEKDVSSHSRIKGNVYGSSITDGCVNETSHLKGNRTTDSVIDGNTHDKSLIKGDIWAESTVEGKSWNLTETLGNSTWRKKTIGHEAGFAFTLGAKAVAEITVGASTETSIKVGLFNSNSVTVIGTLSNEVVIGGAMSNSLFLIGKAGIEIMLGFQFNLEIKAVRALKIELGTGKEKIRVYGSGVTTINVPTKKEIDIDKLEVLLNHTTTALKDNTAILTRDEALVAQRQAAVDQAQASVNAKQAAIMRNFAALKDDRAAMTQAVAALKADQATLQNNQVALDEATTALTNRRTAITDCTTAALIKIG